MSDFDLQRKLKQLKIEERVWVICLGIIFLSWYANNLERNYLLFNDKISKEKYRIINIFIFGLIVVIYFYFLKQSINDIQRLKPSDTKNKKVLTYLSFYGSIFLMVSGIIYLYIVIFDKDLNIEVAFN